MTTWQQHLGPNERSRLVDVLRQPVIATDLELGVTYWNAAAVETFGWTLDEVLGQNILALAVPDFARALTDDIVAVLLAGDPWQGALTVRRRDGTTFTGFVTADGIRDEAGTLVGLGAVVSNMGQMLQPLLMRSREAAVVTGVDAVVRFASPGVERALGWTDTDLAGRSLFDLVHTEDRRLVEDCLQLSLADPVSGPTVEFRSQTAGGGWRWVEALIADLRDDPSVPGLVWTLRDTTDRRAELERMTEAALHDPLTGLPNRALMLDELIRATRRRGGRGALLYLDLDEFKQVNDELGHAAGDLLLKTVAGRLTHLVRPEDTCARWAGDEFLVLNETVHGRAEATALADRVAMAIAEPVEIAGRLLSPQVSIGVAMLDGVRGPEHALLLADEQMYLVKQARRATRATNRAQASGLTASTARVGEARTAPDDSRQ